MKEKHYREAAIDQSFWHIYPEDIVKLEPEDRDNSIWNEGSEIPDGDESKSTKELMRSEESWVS